MERRYERYGPLWLKLDVCMDRYGFHRSRRNGMNGYGKMPPLRVLFGNPERGSMNFNLGFDLGFSVERFLLMSSLVVSEWIGLLRNEEER